MKFLLLEIFIVCIALATATEEEDNVCGNNEGSSLCGRMCEPTCDNPKPNRLFCPRIQCTEVTKSCRCLIGYLRDPLKACVSPEDCPKNQPTTNSSSS